MRRARGLNNGSIVPAAQSGNTVHTTRCGNNGPIRTLIMVPLYGVYVPPIL
ncbi:hypothetical protein J6590_055079 [Homalodisca vitripennis]|nr:hypothetical protein J6590_055079 [Homalodisca vitripennis]